MPIDFPNSPTVNQEFTANGITWKYDGVAWNIVSGGSGFRVSSAAPSSPATGDLWLESDSGEMFFYYDNQWVSPAVLASMPTSAASTITGTNAEGTSTSFARADHNHAIGPPPAWTTVSSFSNSWVDSGGAGDAPVSYQKDLAGFVRLRGVIKSGTMATTAFTLPSGFRPANREFFSVTCDGNGMAGRLDVLANGEVRPIWGVNAFVILGGITFQAA